MVHHHRNYLRLHRRKRGLTQGELAFLLGYQSSSKISRLEQAEQAKVLTLGFTFQLLFGVDPREIYPALYDSVRETVIERIRELEAKLRTPASTQKAIIKRQLLNEALARVQGLVADPRI